MPIDNLSKITSRSGINTTILLEAGNANVTGIVTAAGFDGPFTGGSGSDINSGIVTAAVGLHVGVGGTQFSIVKSIGSTEIEPFTGGCELITDITSTGSTLAANNLRIINDGYILKSELCMFIGKSSFKNQSIKKLAKLLSTKY